MREVRGFRHVAKLYDGWPTFVGGQVIALRMHQGNVRLDITLHYWRGAENLPRYDCPRPFDPADNHRLIRLSFREVENLELVGFNHENVVSQLLIDPGSPMRVVMNPDLRSSFRLQFTAHDAWVSRITPCNQYGVRL
jgi:hypothetical protein